MNTAIFKCKECGTELDRASDLTDNMKELAMSAPLAEQQCPNCPNKVVEVEWV